MPASVSQPSSPATPGSRLGSSTYLLPASTLRPALSLAAEPLENVTLSALARMQEVSRFSARTGCRSVLARDACTRGTELCPPLSAQCRRVHAHYHMHGACLQMWSCASTPCAYQRQTLMWAPVFAHKAHTRLPWACSPTCIDMCVHRHSSVSKHTLPFEHTHRHTCVPQNLHSNAQYSHVYVLSCACTH